MENRLNNLFDWDYEKMYSWSQEKIVHTYQTEETEKVFGERIKYCFPHLEINAPTIVKLHISNDTPNDDLRYGDCTTQGYVVNDTNEFKCLVRGTTEQLVACMKNLIVGDEKKRITSWWIIKYRKFRKGGYEGTIVINYSILSQPNERGASHVYRKYRYYLEFNTARKDFHF